MPTPDPALKTDTSTSVHTKTADPSTTGKSGIDWMSKKLAGSENPTNKVTLEKCREARNDREKAIRDRYEERRKARTPWWDASDGTVDRFVATLPHYCMKAINENRITVDYSNPEYKSNPAYAFYDQYIDENYSSPAETINNAKKVYQSSGASAMVSGADVTNAFRKYMKIGRDEGNFVTSLQEDLVRCTAPGTTINDENVKQFSESTTPGSDTPFTFNDKSSVEKTKGLYDGKYNSGLYMYLYSPEFINNANSKNSLIQAQGNLNGSNPLNLPGMMTWVEDINVDKGNTDPDDCNVNNAESELVVPSIVLKDISDDALDNIRTNGVADVNTSAYTTGEYLIKYHGATTVNTINDVKGVVQIKLISN